MKKIIILLCLLVLSFVTYSQSQYTPMTATGYQEKRLKVDSTIHLPSFCGVPTLRNSTAIQGALAMDTCNNKLYKWTRSAGWSEVAGGGGGSTDTTSLSNRINQKVNISDTAAMLTPYLRKVDTTAMLNPYLREIDTTNKWVNSVTGLNDSTIRVVKNGTINDITIRSIATVTDATRLITAVYNKTGATIPKGSVVYINGAHSSILPTIALSLASTEESSAYTYGLVVDDIANNSQGTVVQNGSITNLNLPTSTYTDGQTLYLSPTVPGGYTLTKPLAPYHYVSIGTVTRAHPTLGTIQVAIRNGFQLDELSDVSIAAVPLDSNILQFSRVDSLWHDVSVTTAIGTKYLKPTDTTSLSNRINTKLNATDTASLSTRINAKGYGINIGSSQINLAANTTYYFGLTTAAGSTTAAIRRVYIPQSGTIKSGYIYMRTTGATSTENWTLSIRLNNTTSTTFATVGNNSQDKVFSNTGLNINVVAGDYIEIITTTPAWTVAAGNTTIYGTLIIQ